MLTATLAAFALSIFPTPVEGDLWQALPGDCLIVLEAPALSDWLKQGLGLPWIQRARALAPVQVALAQAPIQPEVAITMGSLYLGKPLLPFLSELCEGGLCVGFGVADRGPIPYVVMESGNERNLEATLKGIARKVGESQGMAAGKVWNSAKEVHGGRIWELGADMAMGWRGSRLYLGLDAEKVERMMVLKDGDESVRQRSAWRNFEGLADPEAKLRLWFDLKGIESAAPKADLRELRAMATAPAVHFLLGSQFACLGSADSGLIELVGDEDSLQLSLKTHDGNKAKELGLTASEPMPLTLPRITSGDVLRGHFYRNLNALFEHRLDLFPTRAQTKFAEAAANISLFFGGQDPEDSLFPYLSPWIGVVSREVELDPIPALPLPAVCFVAQMKEPETLGPQLIAGFQTAIGLVNVDAAQEREPSMLLNLQVFDGIPVTSAHYLAPPEGMGVDARYNLVPACAVVGDVVVMGTHVDLVRDVARQVKRGEMEKMIAAGDGLRINGPALVGQLKANADAIVLNAVLTKGKSTAQARMEMQTVLLLASQVESLGAKVESPSSKVSQLTIDLQMKPRRSN